MKKIKYLVTTALLLPLVASAQNPTLKTFIDKIIGYLNQVLALMMGVAVVMFVFNVIRYFMRPSDKRAEGAQYVMWSLIGFFVILSFWGLVRILTATFDFGQNSPGSWSGFTNIFPK